MGRMGFGPFNSDDGHGMVSQAEALLAKPLLKLTTKRGMYYGFDEAYAAVALALAIERAFPGSFSDERAPAKETLAKPAQKQKSKPRSKKKVAVKRYHSFWDLSETSLRSMIRSVAGEKPVGDHETEIMMDQLDALLSEVQAATRRRRVDIRATAATNDMFVRSMSGGTAGRRKSGK